MLYLDNGVCDPRSWPGGLQLSEKGRGSKRDWALYKNGFGYATDEEAVEKSARPVDGLADAVKNGVLLISVHGTADRTVPYAENARPIVEFWDKSGGQTRVCAKEGGDHHSHGLPDPAPLIELLCGQPQS